jgi:hypothetical protein
LRKQARKVIEKAVGIDRKKVDAKNRREVWNDSRGDLRWPKGIKWNFDDFIGEEN